MFLPVQTDVPMQRWPIANWVLILVTVVVSTAASMAPESSRGIPAGGSTPRSSRPPNW